MQYHFNLVFLVQIMQSRSIQRLYGTAAASSIEIVEIWLRVFRCSVRMLTKFIRLVSLAKQLLAQMIEQGLYIAQQMLPSNGSMIYD